MHSQPACTVTEVGQHSFIQCRVKHLNPDVYVSVPARAYQCVVKSTASVHALVSPRQKQQMQYCHRGRSNTHSYNAVSTFKIHTHTYLHVPARAYRSIIESTASPHALSPRSKQEFFVQCCISLQKPNLPYGHGRIYVSQDVRIKVLWSLKPVHIRCH